MKLVSKGYNGDNPILRILPRPFRFINRSVFIHASPSGAPVLLEESSWRTIVGVVVNTPNRAFILQLRRFGNKGKA